MRIILTGGNGFIGREFVARQSRNMEIFTVGRHAPATPVARHIHINLAQPGELEAAIARGDLPSQIDVVMHLAVSRLHRTFPQTAPDMFAVNVAASAALLDYAQRSGAHQFILGSTGTVYHPFRQDVLAEDDTTQPESYFGWSKLAAEHCAELYQSLFKLFIPRFFTPYGPGQSDRLVDGLIRNVSDGRAITLPIEGKGLTSAPIYLDDAVNVLEQAVSQGWKGTYNVAGDEHLALEDMARVIGQAVGRAPVFERSPQASGARLIPDITRLKTLIDVSQFVSFADGIKRTLALHQAAA